jgi:hypothetical protein
MGVHHHLIFPIETLAVWPATRRRSDGTSSSLMRTGMRCAKLSSSPLIVLVIVALLRSAEVSCGSNSLKR